MATRRSWRCDSCLVSALEWVRTADTLASARLFSRAVVPALLAFGSETPDNREAARQLTYGWSSRDRRFELRIKSTGEPAWQRVARWSTRSAASQRKTAGLVVDLLKRTGCVWSRPRTPGLLGGDQTFEVRVGGKRRTVRDLAWELESKAPDRFPELGAALRAAVLVASGVETWKGIRPSST